MIKKIITLLMSFILAFSSVTGIVNAQTESTATTDKLYDEAVYFLMDMGIITDEFQKFGMIHYYKSLSAEERAKIYEGFYPEMELTRAEFVMFAVRLMGVDDEEVKTNADEQFYYDVETEHWAYDFIKYATDYGIINGIGDGMFGPNEKITLAQAVKVLIGILGYDMVCEANGGYPYGYIAQASDLGMLKGITASANDNITKRDMAKLLYNSLSVEVIQMVGIEGGKGIYEAKKGEDLLYVNFNVVKNKGLVTSTYYSSLVGESKLNKNQVEIDKVVYETINVLPENLLGHNIEYYYEKDEKKIVYFVDEMRDGSVFTVKADNILEESSYFSKTNFVYEGENAKVKSIKIDDKANVFVNGKLKAGYDVSDLTPALGYVTFVDCDYNGVFDLVKVYSYKNIVVGYVNTEDHTVYDLYDASKSINVDPESDEYDVIVRIDNVEASYAAIKENNIVSLFESENTSGRKLKILEVNTNVINGTVVATNDKEVTVGKTVYEISKDFRTKNGEIINIKAKGNFYFDYDGKVAAMKLELANNRMGLLTNVVESTDNDEPQILFKILNADKSVTYTNCVEKLRINGNPYTEFTTVRDELESTGIYTGYVAQPIRFELNADGEITKIYTTKSTDLENGVDLEYEKYYGNYRPHAKTVDGKFAMTDNTFIIKMPSDISDEISPKDPENYTVINTGSFENYVKYTVDVYNIHDALIADMVLVYGEVAGETISRKDNLSLVESKVTTINEYDEPITVIKAYQAGTLKELVLADTIDDITITTTAAPAFVDIVGENVAKDVVITDQKVITEIISRIAAGDVLRYSVDAKGRVTKLAIDASLDRQTAMFKGTQYHDPCRLYYGKIYDITSGLVAMTTDVTGLSDVEVYTVSGTIYEFDTKTNKISKIAADTLSSYIYRYNPNVKVLLRNREGATNEIIVVK